MKTATLSNPMPIDKPATTLKITHAVVDFVGNAIHAHAQMVDADGNVVAHRTLVLDSAAVKTWIANQENTLLNALMTKLVVSGTIA